MRIRSIAGLLVWCLASALLIGGGPAPDKVTLSEAVRHAVAHSSRMARAKADVAIRDLEAANAEARYYPSLDLTATHGLEKTLPAGPVEADGAPVVSRLEMALTQPIYDNGETSVRSALAAVNREVAAIEEVKARDDLVLEVVRAFYRLSLADILLTIQRRQQELLAKQYGLMLAQYRQGLKTKRDFLRLKSETQRTLIKVEGAVSQRDAAEVELARLLGRTEGDSPLAFVTLSSEDLLKQNLEFPSRTPDIKASRAWSAREAKARATAQSIELVRRKNSPEISLGASARYANSGYLNSGDSFHASDSASWGLLLGFRYNIWDAGTRRRDIDIAVIQGTISDLAAVDELERLAADIANLMNNIGKLKSSLELSRELLNLEETSYAQLEDDYRQGRVAYLDLITALGDLLNARVGYFTAHVSALESLAQYRYYEGTIHAAFTAP